MSKDKKKNSFWNRWRFKYRFVILNSENFEERLSFNISRLNVFLLSCVTITLLMGGTALVIAFSPLREYIPGYTSTNIRRQVVTLNQLSDSLNTELINRSSSWKRMSAQEETTVDRTPEDSLLREQVEAEEKFNFFGTTNMDNQSVENLLFFVPVKGLVTQSFNIEDEHYGVDIVTKENELIKSTLSGVVVFSSWTSETGNVIAVQHENNLLSIYKHNSVLLKDQGERVVAGEAIAIIGNSGKWSSGPHLHFELWYNNNPVNPEQYILF
jgi:murein DD-endopeptidase MepM/ murein hydrolase activator NlpD